MPTTTTLLAFCAATLVFVAVPGPNLLYIVGHGVTGGRRRAVAAAVGVEIGTLIQVAASALGVSAILSRSATAFALVKYVGVLYLVFLGIKALKSGGAMGRPDTGATEPRPMLRGIVVNVLNPKAALFFLAFFPHFVDPGRNALGQTAVLGLVLMMIALAIDLLYAVGASWIAVRLGDSSRSAGTITGSVYLLLAAVALLTGSRPEPA